MRLDLIVPAILTLALMAWLGWQTRTPEAVPDAISLADVLGPAPEHFRRVTGPEPLHFPADHAAHPDYRSEWWYFTGNLYGPDQGRLGFQFTLFRFGLEPQPALESRWQTDSLWMAHLALSDGRQQRFFQAERFARGALGLAGATAERWWLRDWSVTSNGQGWQLVSLADDFGLELDLIPDRPMVLQGDDGYSRKGPEPGNASRYYSATRLQARGRVRVEDQWIDVDGLAWLDREWGSGQLAEAVVGWDWFAIHLDDGRDLMIYRLRHADGSASEFSAGTLVSPDGEVRTLQADDFQAQPVRWWRDADRQRWPLDWELKLEADNLHLKTRPIFDQQLWHKSVRYWEGAIDVFDVDSGKRKGTGYMELSGYATADRRRQ